jgi:hypothetical protein
MSLPVEALWVRPQFGCRSRGILQADTTVVPCALGRHGVSRRKREGDGMTPIGSFDMRWLYWEPETKLLDEKRSEYFPQVFDGNRFIVSQQKVRREWSRPQVVRSIG